MKMSHFSVKHPAVIGMLVIVLATFGIFSLMNMNVSFMSDISKPMVIVVSIYPGASAEDIEQDVTNVLEKDFITLPNFKNITSSSANSLSVIEISFQDESDPYDQLAEVRNRINQKRSDLPAGLQGLPSAFVGGGDMLPILTFSLKGGKDVGRLTDYIENTIRPRITQISGVSGVNIYGGKNLQLSIKINTRAAASKGVSINRVYQALQYGNANMPAGHALYQDHIIDVRYRGSFSSINDIKNLPVGVGSDNIVIYLKDIAKISLAYPKDTVKVKNGSEEIIVAEITKRSDGNVMDITSAIKQILKESEIETDNALEYQIINDDSRVVRASIRTVIISGITGIIMAVLILLLFLQDSRATIIIALSIPLSLLFTFIGMKLLGMSINLISLSGMVVALGMIVDGSIVMIEQVYRYYGNKNNKTKKLFLLPDAILIGADEVSSSIFAGAITTLVVFIPIAFLTGLIGMMLKDLAVTLIFCIAASLLAALIAVPFLMMIFLKKGERQKKDNAISRFLIRLEEKYKRILSSALNHRKLVLSVAIAILGASILLVSILGLSFIPTTDNSDFYVTFEFPPGYSLDETSNRMEDAQRILEKNIPEIKTAVFYSGIANVFISEGTSKREGYAHVVLVPVAERKKSVQKIILQAQELLVANIPDAFISVTNGGFDRLLGFVAGGGGYALTLASTDSRLLYSEALRLKEFLKTDKDVLATSLDTSYNNINLVFDVDYEAMSSLGVSSYEAGLTAAILFQGLDVGRFTEVTTGERYDIHLFSDVIDSALSEDTLSSITVASQSGENVSFSVLARLKPEDAVSKINHTDRIQTITVHANLVSEDTAPVNQRMKAYLDNNPLATGVSAKSGGILELIEDSLPRMLTALLIACFLVYTVMVLQFERFRQPLLIMGTVPFCLIGVIGGLLLFGSTLSLMPLMAMIALAGIVVNNGIILIDYINLLREKQKNLISSECAISDTDENITVAESLNENANDFENTETDEMLKHTIIEGSASRIRPILMTTLTTLLGVVPMAVAKGEGSETYAPLAQAIAGGLFTSTLISLFIIPILYFISEKRVLKKQAFKKRTKKNSANVKILVLFCIGLFFSTQHIQANDTAQTIEKKYTITELVEASYRHDPEVQLALNEYEQSLINSKNARANFQPTINYTLNASFLYNYPMKNIELDFDTLFPKSSSIPMASMLPSGKKEAVTFPNNNFGVGLTLQQPIFLWGKVFKTNTIYKKLATIKNLQYTDIRNKIMAQVHSLVATIYYLQKIKIELKNQKTTAQDLLAIMEDTVNEGALLDQQLREQSLHITELEYSITSIQNTINDNLLTLQTNTGFEDITEFNTPEPPNQIFKILQTPAQDLVTHAFSKKTSPIQSLQIANDIAVIKQNITRFSQYWTPDIALKAEMTYSGSVQSFKDEGFGKDKLSASISIGISGTAWDGGKKWYAHKTSQNELKNQEIQLQSAKKSLKKELLAKIDELTLLKLKIEYQQEKIKTIQMRLDQQTNQYDSGALSKTDILKTSLDLHTENITLYNYLIKAHVTNNIIQYFTDIE